MGAQRFAGKIERSETLDRIETQTLMHRSENTRFRIMPNGE